MGNERFESIVRGAELETPQVSALDEDAYMTSSQALVNSNYRLDPEVAIKVLKEFGVDPSKLEGRMISSDLTGSHWQSPEPSGDGRSMHMLPVLPRIGTDTKWFVKDCNARAVRLLHNFAFSVGATPGKVLHKTPALDKTAQFAGKLNLYGLVHGLNKFKEKRKASAYKDRDAEFNKFVDRIAANNELTVHKRKLEAGTLAYKVSNDPLLAEYTDYMLDTESVEALLAELQFPADKNIRIVGSLKTTNPKHEYDNGDKRYRLPVLPTKDAKNSLETLEEANLDAVEQLMVLTHTYSAISVDNEVDKITKKRNITAVAKNFGAVAIGSVLSLKTGALIDPQTGYASTTVVLTVGSAIAAVKSGIKYDANLEAAQYAKFKKRNELAQRLAEDHSVVVPK